MKSPLFIIGNPRSGTTLLRLMLTCHKEIVVPPECGFAVWLYRNYTDWHDRAVDEVVQSFVADLMKCRKIETWKLDEEKLHHFLSAARPSSYPEATSLVYEYYGLSRGRNFSRWGDKNNFYVDHIPALHEMFPSAYYVHIVRDGRNVACSYKRLHKEQIKAPYAPRLPHRIQDIAQEWRKNLQTINASFDALGRERVHEIRLEDLVCNTQESLTEICSFLGEEFDPAMLDYHRLNAEEELEPKEFAQWKGKTFQPPLKDENDLYKSGLSVHDTHIFEDIGGDMLLKYGYTV